VVTHNNTLNLQSEVAGDFASSSHSFPHNVLNLLNAQQPARLPLREQSFVNDLFENMVHQVLNVQRSPPSTIFESNASAPSLDHERCFTDLLPYEPDDSDIGFSNENLFSTFLHPITVDTGQPDQVNEETASLLSPQLGTQTSIAGPLLEMGFSLEHVRKAMDATSKWESLAKVWVVIHCWYRGTENACSVERGVGVDSSLNQLASWMIEHPCIDSNVDGDDNQSNATNATENLVNVLDGTEEVELSPFSFHSHVSIALFRSLMKIAWHVHLNGHFSFLERNVAYAYVPERTERRSFPAHYTVSRTRFNAAMQTVQLQ